MFSLFVALLHAPPLPLTFLSRAYSAKEQEGEKEGGGEGKRQKKNTKIKNKNEKGSAQEWTNRTLAVHERSDSLLLSIARY